MKMKILNWYLLLLVLTSAISVHKCSNMLPEITACPDFYMTLGSSKNMAKILDVIPGSNVNLYCHFCSEKDNYQGKVWFYRQRGSNKPMKQVDITENNSSRITISAAQTLKIKSFNVLDAGIYLCGFHRNEESIFTYVLDEMLYDNVASIVGTLKLWPEYKRTQIDPINEKFDKSEKEPFITLRNTFKFSFRVITSWERGPCEMAYHDEGKRKILGKCHLHIIIFSKNLTKMNSIGFNKSIDNFFLIDNYDISCRSVKLNEYLPKISEAVRNIPEYEAIETCDIGTTTNYLVQANKDNFKYKTRKQIGENGHVILICPEITLESNIIWYKDEDELNSSYRRNMANSEDEPHLTIDTNLLYILHATKEEEGVYTCTVNGKNMQKYDIEVVAKSKLLNHDFIRYSIYLGFVLSLTITCYCAGICMAWHRRTSFADPLNLH